MAAQDGVDPLGCALPASDEALRSKLHHVSNLFNSKCDMGASACEGRGVTYDAGGWVDSPTQRVDSNDMWRLLVPGSVFAPVARRDFFPRVVEVDGLLEVLHRDRVPRLWSRAPLDVDVAYSRGGCVDMVYSDKGRWRRHGVGLSTAAVWWWMCCLWVQGVLLVKMSVKAKSKRGPAEI